MINFQLLKMLISSKRNFDKVFSKGMDLMQKQMVLEAHGHTKSRDQAQR